jgi:DNA polymerase III sliding clamp (beta) subunit (PCNA family)
VYVSVQDKVLNILAHDHDDAFSFIFRNKMPAQVNFIDLEEPFVIAFHCEYLIGICRAMADNKIVFKMKGSRQAVIVSNSQNNKEVYAIMPMIFPMENYTLQ